MIMKISQFWCRVLKIQSCLSSPVLSRLFGMCQRRRKDPVWQKEKQRWVQTVDYCKYLYEKGRPLFFLFPEYGCRLTCCSVDGASASEWVTHNLTLLGNRGALGNLPGLHQQRVRMFACRGKSAFVELHISSNRLQKLPRAFCTPKLRIWYEIPSCRQSCRCLVTWNVESRLAG